METILKWLNKPKADDKSLLARFFHADRALAAVASELDSFDGRAEPDRCSRLVSRLRQGQDKVLAITNLIIEELLGDERDQRAFRVKFPEEVLQENLAGQLWFGAECLAAGSSIMNREQESKEMRPLAEAVTRSLNNVRFLLRDQCLRNNVPNSEHLNLDKNDAATEQLYESLKRFDRLFAEFEWRYVSAMVQVKSKDEYETQELICVLCSETLQRALKLGLLEQDKVDAFDPALMFSIPRLAIIAGLVIYPEGPLNMDMPAEQLSELFRPFRSILLKVRDYLRNLNETELYCLERLLCTNEEISLKDTLTSKDSVSVTADNKNTKSSKYIENSPPKNGEKTTNTTSKLQQESTISVSSPSCKTLRTKPTRRADSPSPAPSTTSSSSSSDEGSTYNTPVSSSPSSPRSSHSLLSTTSAGGESNGTTSPDSWMQDYGDDDSVEEKVDKGIFLAACDEEDHYADDDDSDVDGDDDNENAKNKIVSNSEEEKSIYSLDNVVEQIMNLEMASVDCITGYLISNTTLGNLLQPQEVPLTDNFVVSDSDLPANEDCNDNLCEEQPSTSAKALTITNRHEHHLDDRHDGNNNNSTTKDRSSSQDTEFLFESSVTNPFIETTTAEEISLLLESSVTSPSSVTTTTRTSSHARRRRYSGDQHPNIQLQSSQQVCTKDHSRSHRHHHRHHHHHHHYNHHTNSTATNNRSSTIQHNQSHHRHRVHHAHGHHHRRPHRHGADKNTTTVSCDKCFGSNSATKEDSTIENSKVTSSFGVLDIETPSSSSSLLEDNKSIARSSGRTKFKHTENLLHRLFVCIAGVADQLQTNFAFDLRQILRSVFLMNMSVAQEELDIPEKSKDNALFEFRASENDVIQASAGSSQSIYSAEEVNPEGDNQSNSSNTSNGGNCSSNTISSSSNDGNAAYRHSTGTTVTTAALTNNETAAFTTSVNQRQQIERSRSLDNQDCPTTIVAQTQQRQEQTCQQQQQQHLCQPHHVFRNRYNSTGSNSPSISSSENSSPICERSTNTTSGRVPETNAHSMPQQQQQQRLTLTSPIHLSPPAWIPDQKAPRCMSCRTPFTAFRRRHHCRNCGGVFCGVCSSNSTPLPKYGLTKAVRVCSSCYTHEISLTAVPAHNQYNHHHHNHHSQLVSQTITNSTNNAPRLRRPVTTTRAID